MQSRAFQIISALFTVVLLLGLVAAVGWTVQTQPSTLVLPTATATPTPTPTPTPPLLLGAPVRVERGGYLFGPPEGYSVRILDGTAMLAASEQAWPDGPLFTLDSGPLSTLDITGTVSLETLLAEFTAVAAERYGVNATGAPSSLRLDGVEALAVDLAGDDPRSSGRLAVAAPGEGRYVLLLGLAPATAWEARTDGEFREVAGSVQFFAPVVPPTSTATPTPVSRVTVPPATATATATAQGRRPTVSPTATTTARATNASTPVPLPAVEPPAGVTGTLTTTTVSLLPAPTAVPAPVGLQGSWTAFSDANVINDLVVISNTIWLATDGGALAWNKGSNNPVKFTTVSGLGANRLTAVANCPLPGFGIVFGSARGLQIVDPRSGRWSIRTSGDGGMRFDDVAALYCDAANQLLVVGYGSHGIDIYDAAEERWRHVDRSSGLADNDVRRLAATVDGEAIWVLSNDSVTVAAGADSTYFDAANSPLAGERVGALAVTADDVAWLGGEGALYRVADEEWTVYRAEAVEGDFPAALISGIGVDADGALWLGAADGTVCRFDPVAEQCDAFFRDAAGMVAGPLTNLTVDRTGQVYYGSAGNGFAGYDGSRWRSYVKPGELLAGNRIKALAADEEGSLWVATEQGIQRFAQPGEAGTRFDNSNSGIAPLGVRTLHPGVGGGMWVGSMQGASFYDGEGWTTFSTTDGLAGNTVQAIAADSSGRTWFGTDQGLSIWNGEIFFNIARERGLPSDDISALAASGDAMWIGTAGGGLYRFENSQLQLLNRDNVGLPSDVITALAQGDDGVLWIGTSQGLARLEGGTLSLAEPVGNAGVTALAVTPAAVWVGTAGDGAWYFDGSNWLRLTAADGLPTDHITAMLADANALWIGGQDGGVVRFEP